MSQTLAIPSQFKYAARMGYAARGVIYLTIGTLALLYAAGAGGETASSRDAIKAILEQPYGQILVFALILGLAGYSAWRSIQAIKDTDDHGTSVKGLGVRSGLMMSAITHALLGIWAATVLLGMQSDSSASGGSDWTGGGAWGVAISVVIGIVLAIVGLAHIYKGVTAGFEKYVEIPHAHRSWAKPLCQFGLIARGVVWSLLAWFFLRTAWQTTQNEVSGLAEALDVIHSADYGTVLLAVVAAGLFAFGAYSCMEAIWRRVNIE